MSPIIHLAFCVTDIEAARHFYLDTIGCSPGSASDSWQIMDFFGHKFTINHDPVMTPADAKLNHFGAIIDAETFHALARRLVAAGSEFLIEPQQRDIGTEQEQWIMLVRDPAGNALEFNALARPERVFTPE